MKLGNTGPITIASFSAERPSRLLSVLDLGTTTAVSIVSSAC